MSAAVSVAPPTSAAELQALRTLFLEYADTLGFDLGFQDFEAEMAEFPGKYAAPGGALLLARQGGQAVGGVALRDLGGGIAEMKRLYVRPQARRSGLGDALVSAVVARARQLGFERMRLDTVKGHHDAAIALYQRHGFRPIPPYCHNPMPDTLYFELDLTAPAGVAGTGG